MLRADVNEMYIETVDLGDELREGVELRLDFAPVVIARPVAGEFLDGRELHALRVVCDGLLLRQARGRDTAAEIDDRLFGNVHPEGANGVVLGNGSHLSLSR